MNRVAVLAALPAAAVAGAADEFAYERSAATGDGVVIVDSRPLDDCRAKTLAGARCLPSADFLGPNRRLPDARNLLWLLGTAGLSGDEQVLVVGQDGSRATSPPACFTSRDSAAYACSPSPSCACSMAARRPVPGAIAP